MSDWTMNIEQFAGGRHNFPKLSLPASGGKKRFVTTVRQFTGTRGRVRYTDHGMPWSVDANNLEITIAKSDRYRGTAKFRDGVITIMKYEPMWAHMQTGFVIDGGRVLLPRIDLQADGSGMYTLQALWTQAREALDVKTIVCANRAYRILRIELARAGIREPGPAARRLTELSDPNLDWVALAKAQGVPAVRVENLDALAKELGGALKERGPRLVEVRF